MKPPYTACDRCGQNLHLPPDATEALRRIEAVKRDKPTDEEWLALLEARSALEDLTHEVQSEIDDYFFEAYKKLDAMLDEIDPYQVSSGSSESHSGDMG